MKLTEQEIKREQAVIYETRLGSLCGAAKPTPEQDRIARSEADQWKKDYLASQAGPMRT